MKFAIEVFDDPFDAFHPTLSKSRVPYNNDIHCPLFTLPRELRDEIYSELVATGHVKLAQVSKAIALEFMEIIWRRGICRLTVHRAQQSSVARYPVIRTLGDRIQYLDLRIVTSLYTVVPDICYNGRMPKTFSNHSISRKHCDVVIEDHVFPCRPNFQVHTDYTTLTRYLKFILPLESLYDFQTLTVKLDSRIDFSQQALNHEQSEIIKKLRDTLYSVLGLYFRHHLGYCTDRNGNEEASRYLEFNPLAYRKARADRKTRIKERIMAISHPFQPVNQSIT